MLTLRLVGQAARLGVRNHLLEDATKRMTLIDCCVQGKLYTTYKCSPAVSSHTKAVLTLNSFEKGGDGGAPSECDRKYHSDDTPVVALSTGWYNKGSRCLNNITISARVEVWWPWLLTSVTLLWDVMKTMTINLPVLITLLTPQRLCGKPWVCLLLIGES
ncbi:putative ripening-related protein 2 [Vitis vinifera]|uniref:Putative ripening-related protein 2 n=1 Tax=Vitis vinifera TaxID=29760 RepID=A0A438H9X2_VITVI|nr:putative ripening-related protein 2 [Vitis vinifera]